MSLCHCVPGFGFAITDLQNTPLLHPPGVYTELGLLPATDRQGGGKEKHPSLVQSVHAQ